jgi:hypothetical protein
MNVGDRFRVRAPSKGTLPSVAALAGQEGVIVEKTKHMGAPLTAQLDDGRRWHCWPEELEKIDD